MLQKVKYEFKMLQNFFVVNEREFCKYFEFGNYVKVVFGIYKEVIGMVVKVDQYVFFFLIDMIK